MHLHYVTRALISLWAPLLALMIYSGCAGAQNNESFQQIAREAFVEDLVKTAQPNCIFAQAAEHLFTTYGQGPEIEELLVQVLFDGQRDEFSRTLAMWLLTEINDVNARKQLILFATQPLSAGILDENGHQTTDAGVLASCLHYMGRTKDPAVIKLLEEAVGLPFWQKRADVTGVNILYADRKDSLISNFRASALMGLAYIATAESVVRLEALARTVAGDLHPTILSDCITEARRVTQEAASKASP